jgi:D-3-phosphoglycerate dehydrogenase
MTIKRSRGLTVGVVGAGRIGRAVAAKARAFGMSTIAHDPYLATAEDALPLVDRGELLARSDVIVLCASATSTMPFRLGRGDFLAMRTPPVIVNVARGALIDEAALAEALRAGTVSAAALDVRVDEPPDPADDPLAGAPNLILTPHVGASSAAAIGDLRTGVAEAAIALLVEAGRIDVAT